MGKTRLGLYVIPFVGLTVSRCISLSSQFLFNRKRQAEPHVPPPLFASRPEFLSRRFAVNGHKLIKVIDLIVIVEYLDVIEANYAISHMIILFHHLCCWISGRNVSVEIVLVEISPVHCLTV